MDNPFVTADFPHFYLNLNETAIMYGVPVAPGWYFWDETGAHYHGPYSSLEESKQALSTYCKELL